MEKRRFNLELAIGAQPTPADLQELKVQGFRSVVNLRRPEESSPLNPEQEGAAVRSLGMEYYHLPISPQNLDSAQADQFREHLRDLPKPIYVHCQGGTRAGALTLTQLGCEGGWSGEQAFQEGEKLG